MDVNAQIRTGLQNQGLPPPSLAWIQTALPSRSPLPPLPALVATVKTRLLAADLTNPVIFDSQTSSFPPNLSNPTVKEVTLPRDTLVQVLDIDNLTKSKWEQVEELEAISRGEQTKGREIIRLPTANEEEEEDPSYNQTQPIASSTAKNSLVTTNSAPRSSTHRLVLQDCKGQKVYGLELKRIDKIGIGTLNIGEKLLVKRGAVVARGTVLLEPANCTVMGGKVEAWQKAWFENRLTRLRIVVGADSGS
ncbi:hypothetical protein F5Y16DRAFT_178277 [Xylariaceae sp. FL0255]|nr:hypothetical protein F5Y16DRAFT_178277 [Xylariaceae sp. FL0255]